MGKQMPDSAHDVLCGSPYSGEIAQFLYAISVRNNLSFLIDSEALRLDWSFVQTIPINISIRAMPRLLSF